VSIKQKRAWKRVDVEKLRNSLRLFIVSSSLYIVKQMNFFCKSHLIKYSRNNRNNCVVNEIHVKIEIALKSKMRQRCIDNTLQTKSLISDAHKINVTEIFQNDEWKEKDNCTRKKAWVSSNLQIFYRFVDEILTFNRLSEEQKSQIKRNI
jgi:hypothetical protein